jgi:hypothetical protein
VDLVVVELVDVDVVDLVVDAGAAVALQKPVKLLHTFADPVQKLCWLAQDAVLLQSTQHEHHCSEPVEP